VIVSVPHGTSAGNMLRQTGLLRHLREFDRDRDRALSRWRDPFVKFREFGIGSSISSAFAARTRGVLLR
jgi:hypothetical protein